MRFFKYRHNWRDAVAIGAVAIGLIGLTTLIANDVIAVTIGLVAIVGSLVALRVTRKPIEHQEKP